MKCLHVLMFKFEGNNAYFLYSFSLVMKICQVLLGTMVQ